MTVRRLVALALLPLAVASCDLDLTNPNNPTEEEVLTSIEGAIALAIGMQDQFAESMEEFVQAPALVTDEWGTTTQALPSYIALANGPPSAVDESFLVVEEPWAAGYRVATSANTLLAGVPNLDLGQGLQTGIEALAKLFKGMAFGMIAQQYEEAVLDLEQEAPPLQPREVVLAEALQLLEDARTDLQGVSDADLQPFFDRVLGQGFDLRNTVEAMLARYHLIAGNYQEAIDAADRVDPNVLSVFTYSAPDRNPVENLMLQLGYTRPLASFVDEAEAGDERVEYWVDVAGEPFGGNPPEVLLMDPEQYAAGSDPFPVYLPDEMKLIQAEAYTRLGQLGPARDLVNEVRTQSASPVDEPVANLPALPPEDLDTEEELLDQIAYERRYELFLQGLRWDDVRRLGEARTTTPTLMFLPIPEQECLANPSLEC